MPLPDPNGMDRVRARARARVTVRVRVRIMVRVVNQHAFTGPEWDGYTCTETSTCSSVYLCASNRDNVWQHGQGCRGALSMVRQRRPCAYGVDERHVNHQRIEAVVLVRETFHIRGRVRGRVSPVDPS